MPGYVRGHFPKRPAGTRRAAATWSVLSLHRCSPVWWPRAAVSVSTLFCISLAVNSTISHLEDSELGMDADSQQMHTQHLVRPCCFLPVNYLM